MAVGSRRQGAIFPTRGVAERRQVLAACPRQAGGTELASNPVQDSCRCRVAGQAAISIVDRIPFAEDRTTEPRGLVVERLHRRFADQIYLRCLRMLECPVEAEDAVQETFLRAYRALPALRDRERALGWLYRIATNVSLNIIRTRRRKGATLVGDGHAFVSPHRSSADHLHHRRLLEQLVCELDQRSLEIVVAHYVDGLSQDEVAAHLGLSRRSVVRQLTRVRRRCRALQDPSR